MELWWSSWYQLVGVLEKLVELAVILDNWWNWWNIGGTWWNIGGILVLFGEILVESWV